MRNRITAFLRWPLDLAARKEQAETWLDFCGAMFTLGFDDPELERRAQVAGKIWIETKAELAMQPPRKDCGK